MSEPVTGTGVATAAVTGVTFVSLFGPLDGPTVIGAFAGAAIFVASGSDLRIGLQLFLGIVLCCRVSRTPFPADQIENILPHTRDVDLPPGPLVASAAVLRILMWMSSKDGPSMLFRSRGGG